MNRGNGFAARVTGIGFTLGFILLVVILFMPVRRIVGELLDTERPLTVTYVDPAYGPAPVVTKLWDLPSYVRIWPDDFLNRPQAYGNVVYVANENVDAHLTAIDTTTGKHLWSVPVDTYTAGRMEVDDRFIYLQESPNVVAIDRLTGKRVWERRKVSLVGDPTIGDLLVLVSTVWDQVARDPTTQIFAVNRATGEEVWRSEIGRHFAVSEYAGSVLALTDTGLVSLSLTTGAVLWEIAIDLPGVNRQRLVVHDDMAVLTDGETVVVAVDLRSRTERWRVPISPGNPVPGMTVTVNFIDDLVVTDSAVLFSRETLWGKNYSGRPEDKASQGQQFALNRATGESLWTSGQFYRAPVADGDRLFALTDSGHVLVEVDARTGAERWRITIAKPRYGPDFILVGTTIYLTNYDDVFEVRLKS